MYGAFGAAVVAARLLGCDREQTVKAICYAGNLGAMITYGFDNHQYGVVARNGVTAAFLGEARCPARTDALEGPYGFYQAQVRRMPTDLGERMDSLGKRFEIMTSILKPHPCTAINLVPTRLLEQLLATHGIAGADVATVVVGRSRQIDLVPMLHAAGPWPSPTEATSSLPFALAAVLLDGTVTAERLNDLNGADIVGRSQQIRIDLSDDPDLLRHTVEVRTRSGITVKDSADVGILRPPRLADILSDEAVTAIGRTKSDELFKMVAELETLGRRPDRVLRPRTRGLQSTTADQAVRVVVAGPDGRMGGMLVERLPFEGIDVVGSLRRDDPRTAGLLECADVLVEFTNPESATELMLTAIKAGVRPVSGTSGLTDDVSAALTRQPVSAASARSGRRTSGSAARSRSTSPKSSRGSSARSRSSRLIMRARRTRHRYGVRARQGHSYGARRGHPRSPGRADHAVRRTRRCRGRCPGAQPAAAGDAVATRDRLLR